jgi:hypothetical protein
VSTEGAALTFTVQDEKGAAAIHRISISPFGTEKINGVAAPYSLSTNWQRVMIYTDGTDWFVS